MVKDLQGVFEALGCKKYEKDGELTKAGSESYGKLIAILDHLKEQDLVSYDVDKLDKYVNEVLRLGF